jgi:hypothetical protein
MPITQASTPDFSDHRIFGYDLSGQIRVSLFNGPACHAPGQRYSWTWAPTARELAGKLERLWEQPVSDDEWEAIEQLEASMNEVEVSCDDCGGTGIDAGGLSAHEPEDCRSCGGSGQETVPALVGFGSPDPAPRIASIGNGLYVRTRKAVA